MNANLSIAQQPIAEPSPPALSIYDRTFFKVVTEIVVRILFPFAVMWLVASILPVGFSAVVLTGAVLGASLLAALFFQPETFICPPVEPERDSLLGGNLGLRALNDVPVPADMPRGIANLSNNCWLNSILQALRVVPFFSGWLRDPAGAPEMAPFRNFYNAYDASVQGGHRIVQASSQNLRAALNGFSDVIELDPRVQTDASEGMTVLLGRMPNEMQGSMREIKHYSEENLPRILDRAQTVSNSDPEPFLNIELTMPNLTDGREAVISDMLAGYFNDTHVGLGATEGVNRVGEDRAVHRYPLARTERIIERAPPALVVTMKRYTWGRPVPSALHNIPILNWFFPPQAPNAFKNDDPVQVGDQITIPTAQGPRNYRLKSIVFHDGDDLRSGHYFAFGEENGRWYRYDDRTVTPDVADLEERRRHAYILIFEAL